MREIKNAGLWKSRLLEFDTLLSTNQWALENISSCRHGDVVLALNQTHGHGRFERLWHSPPGKCLTFSVILTPGNPDNILFATASLAAAVATRGALHDLGVQARLKWPNDVVTDKGKIAGILCETEIESTSQIMGIGLNVDLDESDLPRHPLLQPATSIVMETGRSLPPADVLSVVLGHLEHTLDKVSAEGMPFLLKHWNDHDALKGKTITLQPSDGEAIVGIYTGLGPDGRLQLQTDTGKEQSFWSGDISLRKT